MGCINLIKFDCILVKIYPWLTCKCSVFNTESMKYLNEKEAVYKVHQSCTPCGHLLSTPPIWEPLVYNMIMMAMFSVQFVWFNAKYILNVLNTLQLNLMDHILRTGDVTQQSQAGPLFMHQLLGECLWPEGEKWTEFCVFQVKWTSSYFFTEVNGERVLMCFQFSRNIIFGTIISLIIARNKEFARTTQNRGDEWIVGRFEETYVCLYLLPTSQAVHRPFCEWIV